MNSWVRRTGLAACLFCDYCLLTVLFVSSLSLSVCETISLRCSCDCLSINPENGGIAVWSIRTLMSQQRNESFRE